MTAAGYPRYESYKDSGVEWIGEIPTSWKQVANKYLFRVRKEQVGKRSSEYDLLSLTLRGIIKRNMENPEGKFPAEFDTYQEVRPGDFVFCQFDVEETPRAVGLSSFHGMITGAYTVYELESTADKGFFYYFYLNADNGKKLRALYKGLRNTIPKDSFAALKTPFPSLTEQRAISAFLDEKCAKIDEAIRIKEEQIKLLRERRQILIQQAVTRGLNPDAPMKDSGIDWIGQIPEHWKVSPIRSLFGFRNEKNDPIKTKNILSLSIAKGVTRYSDKDRGGNKRKDDLTAYKLAHPNDIVLNSMNVIVGAVGRSKYFGAISPVYYALFLQDHDSDIEYFEFIFSNSSFQRGLLRYGKGILMKLSGTGQLNTIRMKISQSDLKILPLPHPPKSEQLQIVKHLRTETKKIDGAISIKEDQIAALKEYKTTLINAAVTGKIRITPDMLPTTT